MSTLHGSELFKHSAVSAFVLGSTGLAGISAIQLSERAIGATSRMRHLYQLSKDFNHALFGNAAEIIKMALWSSCNHLLRVTIVFCLAIALGIWLSPLDTFVLVPSALLIAMVPISLAGWGVREVVFIQAFSLAGVVPSQALALSLLYGLVGLITGLLGGGVWFIERRLQTQSVESSSTSRHA